MYSFILQRDILAFGSATKLVCTKPGAKPAVGPVNSLLRTLPLHFAELITFCSFDCAALNRFVPSFEFFFKPNTQKLLTLGPPNSKERGLQAQTRGRISAHLKIAAAERSMGDIEMVRHDGSTMLRKALGSIILCFLSC